MKKGQAAMEFLMTYGWAILVVLVAIGALAYLGVLSPSKHIPESCIFSQGIACLDFKVTPTVVNIYLQNGFAQDIDLHEVTAGNCNAAVIGQRLADLSRILVNLTSCNNGIVGDRYKEDIIISYSLAGSSLMKEHKGEIIAKIS